MPQPELTSLVGLRDSEGDRLLLLRVDRPHGPSGYLMRVGAGKVFLTAGDLARLSAAIRFELVTTNRVRLINGVAQVLILCVLAWLLANFVTGPLFAYPWSE